MDALSGFGRTLMFFGGILFALGVALVLGAKVPFLGRLPGDILLERDGATIYIPVATMLVVSLMLTVLLNLLSRIFR